MSNSTTNGSETLTNREIYLPFTPLQPIPDNNNTMAKLFLATATTSGSKPFCSTRATLANGKYGAYASRTYSQTLDDTLDLATTVAAVVRPGERVGILSGTRYAWLCADIACQLAGATVVPLYDTLTDDDLAYISETSNISLVFCNPKNANRLVPIVRAAPVRVVGFFDDTAADAAYLGELLSTLTGGMELAPCPIGEPKCTKAAVTGNTAVDSRVFDALAEQNVACYTVSTLQRAGRVGRGVAQGEQGCYAVSPAGFLPARTEAEIVAVASTLGVHPVALPAPQTPEDEATIVFTSGSTGTPKGAVLTNLNFTADCFSCSTVMSVGAMPFAWRHMAFLPLAHIFERQCEWLSIQKHGEIFYLTSLPNFSDDIGDAQPTFMAVVPRILERIYRSVHSTIGKASPVVRKLFALAVKVQRTRVDNGMRRSALFDKLVFAKIKKTLGGRLKVIACGSAPLNSTIGEFVELATTARVTEGYGASETACLSFALPFQVTDWGTCGTAIPGAEAKIVSRPDVNPAYTVDNEEPTGELCLRGPMIFSKYLNAPEATAAVFDKDGWFCTGDVCKITKPMGDIKIVDRVRAVFKLSQGEYVCASKVDSVLSSAKYIEHICVFGSSQESFLVAVARPDMAELHRAFPGLSRTDSELLRVPEVHKEILADLQKVARAAELKSYEIPLYIGLCAYDWTPEGGELTPSLKARRNALNDRYADLFARFYDVAHAEQQKNDAHAQQLARAQPRIRLYAPPGRGNSAGVCVLERNLSSKTESE